MGLLLLLHASLKTALGRAHCVQLDSLPGATPILRLRPHHVAMHLLQDVSWNAGKKSMGNVDAFLKSLISFDKDNTPLQCVERVEKDFLSNPNFNADYIRSKSGAAAGLCGWVVNICKYFRIYQVNSVIQISLFLGIQLPPV